MNEKERAMTDDPRCCGSGTCIINDAGECWCGQRWDGQKMCSPVAEATPDDGAAARPADNPPPAAQPDAPDTRGRG